MEQNPNSFGSTPQNPPITQQPTNNAQPMQGYPMGQQAGMNNYNPQQGQQMGYPKGQQQQMMNPGYAQPQQMQYQMPMGMMMGGYPPGPPPILMPPAPVEGVPVGLEYLIPLSHVFVKQQIELLEALVQVETANRYDVIGGNGQRIYFANETTDTCALCCGGSCRPFTIDINDFFGRPVLVLERPCDPCLYISHMPCCCCWCGVIGGDMLVNLPGGTNLGQVKHTFNCCTPKYDILDSSGTLLMVINGPGCGDCCGAATCGVADFPIVTASGTEIGVIRKTFSGFMQEFLTDADNFGVEFPPDLDVKWKALIFAAVFLIDFMYFEESPNRQRGGGFHSHHHF